MGAPAPHSPSATPPSGSPAAPADDLPRVDSNGAPARVFPAMNHFFRRAAVVTGYALWVAGSVALTPGERDAREEGRAGRPRTEEARIPKGPYRTAGSACCGFGGLGAHKGRPYRRVDVVWRARPFAAAGRRCRAAVIAGANRDNFCGGNPCGCPPIFRACSGVWAPTRGAPTGGWMWHAGGTPAHLWRGRPYRRVDVVWRARPFAAAGRRRRRAVIANTNRDNFCRGNPCGWPPLFRACSGGWAPTRGAPTDGWMWSGGPAPSRRPGGAAVPLSSPARTVTISVGATLVVALPYSAPVRGFGRPQGAPLQMSGCGMRAGRPRTSGAGAPTGGWMWSGGPAPSRRPGGAAVPLSSPARTVTISVGATLVVALPYSAPVRGFGHPQGAPLQAGGCGLAGPPLRGGREAPPSRCHCRREP